MRTLRFATLLAVLAVLAVPLAASELSCIYSRGGKTSYVTAGNVNVNAIGRIAKKYGGTFLWVERDGEEYVIRDAATLAEVEKAFAPLDAMSPELEALVRGATDFRLGELHAGVKYRPG